MAIRLRYEPAAAALAQAGDIAGQGQLAKEAQRFYEQRRQYDASLDEKKREFDMAHSLNVEQLGLNKERFMETVRQFGLQHALKEAGLAETQRQFDASQEFRDRSLGESTRRFDLGHQLNQERFGEGIRQFDLGQQLSRDQLGEGARRFNLGYGLDRDRFAESQQQFDINDWFRRRQAVEGQRRFNQGLQADYARMAQQNKQFGASLGQRQREADALNLYRQESLGQAAHQAELSRQHAFDLGKQQHEQTLLRQEEGIEQRHKNAQEIEEDRRIHREAKGEWDAIQADRRNHRLEGADYDSAVAQWQARWGPQGVKDPYMPPDTRSTGEQWYDSLPADRASAPDGYPASQPVQSDGYWSYEANGGAGGFINTKRENEVAQSQIDSNEQASRANEQAITQSETTFRENQRRARDKEIQTKKEQRQKEYQAGIEGAEAKYAQEIKEYNEDVESDLSSDYAINLTTPEVTEENMEFWARTGQRVEFNEDDPTTPFDESTTVKDYGDIPREVRDSEGWVGSSPFSDSDKEKARWVRLWKAYDERQAARDKAKTDAESGFSSDLAAVPMDNKFNTGTPEEASAAFTAKLNDPKDGIGIGEMVQISGHTVRVTPNLHAAAMEYQRAPDGSPEQSALLTVLVQEIRAARETL